MADSIELNLALPDFLERETYGEIRLKGSRILLPHVVRLYRDGYTPEMIWEEFTSPSLSHIHKVIAFYLDHRATIDDYMATRDLEIEKMIAAAPPPRFTLEELRRRKALLDVASSATQSAR